MQQSVFKDKYKLLLTFFSPNGNATNHHGKSSISQNNPSINYIGPISNITDIDTDNLACENTRQYHQDIINLMGRKISPCLLAIREMKHQFLKPPHPQTKNMPYKSSHFKNRVSILPLKTDVFHIPTSQIIFNFLRLKPSHRLQHTQTYVILQSYKTICKHLGSQNALKYKQLCFLGGPEDDLIKAETCRPVNILFSLHIK